jgi:single-strand DNA-binding protein
MINEVLLVGRVGKDATVRTLESGKKVMSFTLATWYNVKDEKHESGWRQNTEWHQVVSYSEFADKVVEKVKKGAIVSVLGSIHYREYEKDGEKKYFTEIVGDVKVIKEVLKNKTEEKDDIV